MSCTRYGTTPVSSSGCATISRTSTFSRSSGLSSGGEGVGVGFWAMASAINSSNKPSKRSGFIDSLFENVIHLVPDSIVSNGDSNFVELRGAKNHELATKQPGAVVHAHSYGCGHIPRVTVVS